MWNLLRAPILSSATLAVFAASCDSPGIVTESFVMEARNLSYEVDGVALSGYLARPEDATDLPGVLVVHEWWGHNEYARERARDLAKLGYVAFALDMYGDGKLAEHPSDAMEFSSAVMSDAGVMRARFEAALDLLNQQDGVDPERTAAIGYCMGGGIVLAMARAGVDLDAVASFHGSLGAAMEGGPGNIGTQVLVCTGGDDPFVPMETVEAFEESWQGVGGTGSSLTVQIYPGVKHSFTNPDATAYGQKFDLPLVYDADADAKSWEAMKALFAAAL